MADSLRSEVADEIEAMCTEGGLLDRSGAMASINLFPHDRTRRRTINRIIHRYLAEQNDVIRDRQYCCLATAGPPGAGKSTSIQTRGLAGRGWRVLDADRIKDYLLHDALEAGVYQRLLTSTLADGGTLMPRELATLVHSESTKIVDALQEQCMDRGENLVIEGTFSWSGLGPRLLTQLGAAGYEKFTIIDVEVPRERAQEQALGRWWTGRQNAVVDPMGGRFTPAFVIAALYQNGPASICAVNAQAAFDHPLTKEIHSVELLVDDYTSGTLVQRMATRCDGELNYNSETPSAAFAHQEQRGSILFGEQRRTARSHTPSDAVDRLGPTGLLEGLHAASSSTPKRPSKTSRNVDANDDTDPHGPELDPPSHYVDLEP